MFFFLYCFFFKQKTAYEREYGLVGSEMCIRDSSIAAGLLRIPYWQKRKTDVASENNSDFSVNCLEAVSYTHLTLPTSDLV